MICINFLKFQCSSTESNHHAANCIIVTRTEVTTAPELPSAVLPLWGQSSPSSERSFVILHVTEGKWDDNKVFTEDKICNMNRREACSSRGGGGGGGRLEAGAPGGECSRSDAGLAAGALAASTGTRCTWRGSGSARWSCSTEASPKGKLISAGNDPPQRLPNGARRTLSAKGELQLKMCCAFCSRPR